MDACGCVALQRPVRNVSSGDGDDATIPSTATSQAYTGENTLAKSAVSLRSPVHVPIPQERTPADPAGTGHCLRDGREPPDQASLDQRNDRFVLGFRV